MHPISTDQLAAPTRTDAAILDDIWVALEQQKFDEIRTTVVHGIVTIAGKVDSWSDRRSIVASIGLIDGVRRVINALELRAPPLDELALRMSIEQALARRAMREARGVELAIEGRHVTATGIVETPAARAAVLGALVGTAGVHNVEDHLRIAPRDRTGR